MDIYTYLKTDHQKVADMMEKLIAVKDSSKREQLFEMIKQELTLHADTEEITFYKAIEEATRSKHVHEKMEHADEEHDEIRKYLKKLSSLPLSSEKWMEQFGEFKHAVTHHVEEEEGEIFEKAKKYLSPQQAKELAVEMDNLKKQKMQRLPKAA